MNKNITNFINQCVGEGIITDKQRSMMRIKAQENYSANIVRVFKLSDLLVTMVAIILVLAGFTIMYMDENFLSVTYKTVSALTVSVISFGLLYKAKVEDNYFLREVAVLINGVATAVMIMSVNMGLDFRYRTNDNLVIAIFATLPIMAVSGTYLCMLVYSLFFYITNPPILNIMLIPYNDVNFIQILCMAIFVVVSIRFYYRVKNIDKDYPVNEYLSPKVQCLMLEASLVILFFKVFRGNEVIVDIAFLYIVLAWLLVRRSVFFSAIDYIPKFVDDFIFLYIISYYALNQSDSFYPAYVIMYHGIYYMIYILLRQNNRLRTLSNLYLKQYNFYVNILFLSYMITNITHMQEMTIIILMAIGVCNVYLGRHYNSIFHIILGGFVVTISSIVAAYYFESLKSGLMLIVFAFFIFVLYFSRIKQVMK